MRFCVVAERVLNGNELSLDDAVLRVTKATGEELNIATQQELNGKSCKANMSLN